MERVTEGPTAYYVIAPGAEKVPGGGAFDGTIKEIGWNQDWILARVKRLAVGNPNGWYLLNVKTGEITGPFEDAQLKLNPALASVRIQQPAAIFSGKK